MQDALERIGVDARVMSALPIGQVCEDYDRRRAIRHLEQGPHRHLRRRYRQPVLHHRLRGEPARGEIGADLMIKATKVDGIYSDDPLTNPTRVLSAFDLRSGLREGLGVMDATAIVLCRDNGIPLRVMNIYEPARWCVSRPARTSAPWWSLEPNMIDDIKKDAAERMGKSAEALRHELAKIRTGRAHPSLLDHIKVSYYGSDVPISQVANVAVEDARTLTVTPWDRTWSGGREGHHPVGPRHQPEHRRYRDPRADAGADRRASARPAAHRAPRGRAGPGRVRNIRRDANNELKELVKEKLISEDDERRGQEIVQKLTDQFVKEVDQILEEKEADLMSI
jgi:ribosome recycling factor